MRQHIMPAVAASASLLLLVSPTTALDRSVDHIRGDLSRGLLGDGTGVTIGIIDSGIDDTHSALSGNNSQGLSRLVAEGNFVPTENSNTGDDVFGHGTGVASVILSNNATHKGLAPDARYVNARVLDNGNNYNTDSWVRNGIGFALENGAEVLNVSLNYGSPFNDGQSNLDKMLDWAAEHRGAHVAVTAGNIGGSFNGSYDRVRGPGSLFNGLSVGRTGYHFSQVHADSANAFTTDGRVKPDLVAPGTSITMANDDHEITGDFTYTASGTSFASPHVAGLLAQQLDYGKTNNLSINPLVTKATMMNATKVVKDKSGSLQSPAGSASNAGVLTVTQPLSASAGAGQIDGVNLFHQYSAGEFGPGTVNSTGWDLNETGISEGSSIDYIIGTQLEAGTEFVATLTWLRHVSRTDNGNGIIDALDTFTANEALDDLNLQILKNGNLIAQSASTKDNVEHLRFTINETANYTLRVLGADITGTASTEAFALAWTGTAIPEPTTAAMMTMLGLAGIRRNRKR
ncbi:S8 family serine peptidase [Poriferisphaera sp. WC338]|uniref:S8 family serine peptidase n=1 Tax=Poriferisphaera sp. WC338 TaxID=3425129 RepID=UPI003D813805